MATADSSSLFSGWAGDCSTINNGDCRVAMNGNRGVTATFDILPPVRILGGNYYDTLQSAYGSCGTSCTIQAKGDELSGNLNTGSNSSVILQGGYDSDYSTTCSYTVLKGILTLIRGSLTVTNLIVE